MTIGQSIPQSPIQRVQCALVFVAAALPLTWAYQSPPQPAFYGQWLSLLLWCLAGVALLVTPKGSTLSAASTLKAWINRPLDAFTALIALFGIVVLAHVTLSLTPLFVAFPTLAAVAVMLLWCIAIARCEAHTLQCLFGAVCAGLVFAACFNVLISLLQLIAPSFHHPIWIAQASGERPYGNLRQPNLFALLLVWGAICAVYLLRGSTRARIALCAMLTVFALALIITDSRSGWSAALLCVVTALGLLWRSTARDMQTRRVRTRALLCVGALIAATVLALLCVVVASDPSVSNAQDMRALSISQRIALWRNVVELIGANPWIGVGYGQLAFAWLLTPLSPRAADLFDHAHNAPLHLAVELGIPVAAALVLVLLATLTSATLRSFAPWRLAALMLLLAAATQSLFEYPLWFAFFAMPSAAVMSLLCASASPFGPAAKERAAKRPATLVQAPIGRMRSAAAVAATVAGIAIAVWTLQGYRAISNIYAFAHDPHEALLRAKAASNHLLYGHYADYAQIMLLGDDAPLVLFSRPTRATLDDRLLTAWARAFERANDPARARYLIERAAEYENFQPRANLPLIPSTAASAAATLSAADFK